MLALLSTSPYGNFAFNDDWSFGETAKIVAKTGQFRYNGWSEPSIGVQAYWGALFLHVFGDSHQVLRLSTLPVAFGCVLLVFATARRLGLPTSYSAFASLAVMASPLMIPLSTSFMTEIPSLFFLLISFYAGVRALQTDSGRAVAAWLAIVALSSFLGGTVRQIGYFPALLSLPLIGIRLRRVKFVLPVASLLWAAVVLCMVLFEVWYKHQPGSVVQPMVPTVLVAFTRLPGMFYWTLVTLMTTIFLLFPITVLFLNDWRKASKRTLIGVAVFLIFFFIYSRLSVGGWIIVPFGNMVDLRGVTGTAAFLGKRPFVVKGVFYLALIILSFFSAVLLWMVLRSRDRPIAGMKQLLSDLVSPLTGLPTNGQVWCFALLPFLIAYPILAIVHGTTLGYFDRYLVPMLPGLALGVLYLYWQHSKNESIAVYSWALAALFALFGVACTHDYFVLRRAVEQTAADLVQRGVPEHQICAGFEHDAMTQLKLQGTVAPLVWAHQMGTLKEDEGRTSQSWFMTYAPALNPKYYVAAYPTEDLVDANFKRTPFKTWLPPYRGQVSVRVSEKDRATLLGANR